MSILEPSSSWHRPAASDRTDKNREQGIKPWLWPCRSEYMIKQALPYHGSAINPRSNLQTVVGLSSILDNSQKGVADR